MDYCIYLAMKELGYPQEEALKGMATIQRNPVPGSAIGRTGLVGSLFGLAVRLNARTLSLNTWVGRNVDYLQIRIKLCSSSYL